ALGRSNQPWRGVYYRAGNIGGAGHQGCTGSKLAAAGRAFRARGSADKILVWHVDLLKLLPFVKRRNSRTYLFLHGIECWTKMSRICDLLLRSVDVFLTNSAFTWARFLEFNPRWRAAPHLVVALGEGTVQQAPDPPVGNPTAIVIGRMEESEAYKGHKELLRAWPLVQQRHPRAELGVVGGGDLEPELKALAATLGIHETVKFHGRVPDEQKLKLIAESRCLLLPSRGEGFGLVYLEAMRQGRPCLVSTLDAGREVVRPPEAGLAVDPGDIPSIGAAAIRLLSAGAEWDAWSARARALYDANFTAAHFEERLLSALRA
ncbi:MAG: glycosyltransferase family 4 protein, partial [Acidobacteriota bacterium]|nr:glycosyltransferase family 4 protein [Acidobacteriota bacterium]